MTAHIADTAIVYPGTIVGDDCRILDYAVVGKPPTLSPRSTAKQEELQALELGAGTTVSTAAIVFAGTHVGARAIVHGGLKRVEAVGILKLHGCRRCP